MAEDPSDKDPPAFAEGTRIDLGEDLLEKTALLQDIIAPKKSFEKVSPISESEDSEASRRVSIVGTPEELFENARILVLENLADDAKPLLHQVLIRQPSHLAARKLLNEIHEKELKAILSDEQTRRSFSQHENEVQLDPEQVDALIEKLDQDLELGLGIDPKAEVMELSLFLDGEIDQYAEAVERGLSGGSIQDRIDLGVGFIEMEIYPIAIRLLSGAVRRVDPEEESQRAVLISATAILGLCLFLAKRPYEAISQMQPVLRNSDIAPQEKIELIYLMGRIYESLKKEKSALGYYNEVAALDPSYRDVELRLSKRRG